MIHAPPKQERSPLKRLSPEAIIRFNAKLVEDLYLTPVWLEIIQPLIAEGIASVCGRLTNGRYYHGALTKQNENKDFSAGYQKSLMDLNNYINDFVKVKNDLALKLIKEEEEKKAPIYNPFLEKEPEV